jgi:hypothetical protein
VTGGRSSTLGGATQWITTFGGNSGVTGGTSAGGSVASGGSVNTGGSAPEHCLAQPELFTVKALAVGAGHVCALMSNTGVRC